MRSETFGTVPAQLETPPAVHGSHHRLERCYRAAISLVFPPACPLCNAYDVPNDGLLCAACLDRLLALCAEPACPRCATTIGPHGAASGDCSQCRGRSLGISGTARIAHYTDEWGQAIRAFKYEGRHSLLPLLVDRITRSIQASAWQGRVEAIVPVPTHWRHRIGRPFYTAELLAGRVASRLGVPNMPIIRRVRAGPHQIGLSLTQRQANVRGAFAVAKGVRMENARVLLIDDVRTTGSTLEECARVLMRNGCSEVYAAVTATAGGAESLGQPIHI